MSEAEEAYKMGVAVIDAALEDHDKIMQVIELALGDDAAYLLERANRDALTKRIVKREAKLAAQYAQ